MRLVALIRSNILQVSTLILTVSFLIWTVSPGWGAVHQEKILKQRDYHSDDPLKIVDISAANKQIRLDERFTAGDDWLNGMRLQFKNISNKDINYIEIQFNLPETRSSGNEMSFRSELGNMPALPVRNKPLLLKPNEDVTYNLNQDEYQSLLGFVRNRHRISDINDVELKIGFVVFADLTAWSGGILLKQSSSNPRRWIPTDSQSKK